MASQSEKKENDLGFVRLSTSKSFDGSLSKYEHTSNCLGGLRAKFSVYLPPNVTSNVPAPVLYFLSGLTCNEDNFFFKAGAQKIASRYGIALVACDTSPRGAGIEGEDKNWDFGTGAGFYLNATAQPWNAYYNMYDYVVNELPHVLRQSFSYKNDHGVETTATLPIDTTNASVFGHSMGGHGALVVFLKNRRQYKSVSAFSAVCNPINCRWGQKAFENYLGKENAESWKDYDATELVLTYTHARDFAILLDQGTKDGFLSHGDDKHNQLRPDSFADACKKSNIELLLRYQNGYDHSYNFIATFMEDHIRFHAKYLGCIGAESTAKYSGSLHELDDTIRFVDNASPDKK